MMSRYFWGMLIVSVLVVQADLMAQTRQGSGTGNAAGRGISAGGGQAGRGTAGGTQGTGEIDSAAGTSGAVQREFSDEGIVGQSDNMDRFVGNEQAGTQQLRQQAPNFQQFNTGGDVQGGQASKMSKVRPVVRLGSQLMNELSRRSTSSVSPRRLNSSLLRKPRFSDLEVIADAQGSLILRGTVATPREKKLAEAYLRLEPGVKKITNQIDVQP